MADAEGNQWDLSEYFSEALLAYPDWRVGYAMEINKAGQVACILVPNDHDRSTGLYPSLIVAVGKIGNIYGEPPTLTNGDPPTLTTVDEFSEYSGFLIEDLNEEGDVLVEPANGGPLYLYSYPFTEPPVVMPMPAGPELTIQNADLSNTGQVIFSAESTTTTTSTRGNRTVTSTTTDRNIYSWNIDGSLELLGEYPEEGIPQGYLIGASDSGAIYGNVDGIAQLWSPATGAWQPIAPTGRVRIVSKAPSEEEVVIWSTNGTEHFIYQSGYGTFPIEVTSGLNGAADLDLWGELLLNAGINPIFSGISRPNSSGSGYLCGLAVFELPDRSRVMYPFILTPIPVAQP